MLCHLYELYHLYYADTVQSRIRDILHLVTTCNLVAIFQKTTMYSIYHIKPIGIFSGIMQFNDSFCGNKKCH